MNVTRSRLILLFTLALACAGHAVAQIVVNIDFDYLTNGSETYSGQGAYADPGNNFWNVIKSTNVSSPPTFLASDGVTATGITLTLSGAGSAFNFSSGGSPSGVAGNLMQDYLYTFQTSSDPVTFVIGGLTAGTTYDIYIYSAVGGFNWTRDRQAVFTLDGTSLGVNGFSSATDGGPLYSAFVEGDNYLLFTVTPTGTSINGSFYTTAGEAEFNGLQIVQMAAVPEPSTYAAWAGIVALAATVGVRRRKSSPTV